MKTIITLFLVSIILFCTFISVPTWANNHCNILPRHETYKLGLPWKKVPCVYTGVMWGQSLLEKTSSWKIETKRSIEKRQILIDKFKNEGCTLYFDGCNTCSKDKDTFSCTIMACSEMKQPKCLSYTIRNSPIPNGNENNSIDRDTTKR